MRMRLRFRDAYGEILPTRRRCGDRTPRNSDGNPVEDAAEPIATFSPGHTPRQHDDGLGIHAATGEKVATFHGSGEHVAQIQSDGALHIFRAQSTTQDGDGPLSTKLARLNRFHSDYYEPKQST